MLSFEELNKAWAKAARAHALEPLQGERGPYRAIGDKTLALLDPLWASANRAPDIGALLEAGKTVRFWADPHFGHDNIRAMCERVEFESVERMDQSIWERVARSAEKSDLVVCLGDLALKGAIDWHKRLRRELGGRHAMVTGNHDVKGSKPEEWVKAGALASLAFSVSQELIKEWMSEDEPEAAESVDWSSLPRRVHFGALHWPVPPGRLPSASWVSLHGHIHNRAAGPLRVNCSVEAIGYEPKSLRELISSQLLRDLIRRQNDPLAFAQEPDRSPGDASYL